MFLQIRRRLAASTYLSRMFHYKCNRDGKGMYCQAAGVEVTFHRSPSIAVTNGASPSNTDE